MMRKLVILVIAALLATTSAYGLQISQTLGYNGTPTFNQDLTFNQFDDNGGTYTLNSIQVIVTLNATGGKMTLDNDGADPASGNWEFGAKGSISSSDVSLLNSSVSPITAPAQAIYSGTFSLDGNVGDGAGDYDPSAPDGMQYTGTSTSDTQSDYVGSSFWGTGSKGFLGSGTYDINIAVNQWLNYGSVGGIEYASTPVTSNGSVNVIYDYTVPEPTTVALLSIGIAGLLRKKRTA